jgi:hypothetical protein
VSACNHCVGAELLANHPGDKADATMVTSQMSAWAAQVITRVLSQWTAQPALRRM